MVKKHLITTSYQAVWPKNKEKIIFLGEWCKLYAKKKLWDNRNNITLDYHWDNREKFKRDSRYLIEFYEKTLENISLKLNEIHNVNYSSRYWRILVGPWLALLIQAVFDRWEMIQVAINSKYELKTNIIVYSETDWISNDYEDFKKLVMEHDGWNNFIYTKIIILHKKKFEINKLNISEGELNKKNLKEDFSLKLFVFSLYQKIANFINNPKSSFIISSYLSKVDEIILCLKLFQLPLFINISKTKKCLPDINQRKWKLNTEANSEFEKFIHSIIPFQIPTVYLEGYKSLIQKMGILNWPKSPKSIFTSNAMIGDDVFKHYAGSKNKSPLIIGQHGGSYGISLINFSEYHELSIADNYVSWGWTNRINSSKIYTLGQLNKHNRIKSDKTKLTIINNVNPRYSYYLNSMTLSSQWLKYFDDQINLVRGLDNPIIKNTIIRLSRHDYSWNQKKRWQDVFPNLKYDNGFSKIEKLYKKTRLCVVTYNATSYLETFKLDIPTILFWDKNFWEIRDEVKPFFIELKKAKVYHDSPESAYKHINYVWNNVDEWWKSKKVVSAINKFNESLNVKNEKIIHDLSKVLKK